MVDLVSHPIITVLHLVGITSLFDASAHIFSSVYSYFDLHPLRPSTSTFFSLRPSTSIHFDLQPPSTSTFIHFNLHSLQPSSSIHFDLQLQPSSRFDLRSPSRLCHTRMVCWLGVSRFRKMRKRLGACGFTPNRAWHHESGVPFHRVWCGGQTLFAAGLPFSLSCEPSLHVVGVEDRRSL